MKIYSYYDNIKFDNQNELVSLWKRSWEKQGFIPIVLSSDDAKKHPYYEEFVIKLKSIHKEIAGKELQGYGLSCYLRWLAYANQNETDCFLMSDYDVINKNFKIDDIKIESNEMYFLDRYCPCFAYGNSQSCFEFCKDIVEYSEKFKQNIKEEYVKHKCVWYHDQEFLSLNHKQLNYNILTGYVDLYKHGIRQKDADLLHVAHRSVGEAKSNNITLKDINDDELRINLVKNILGIPSYFDEEKYDPLNIKHFYQIYEVDEKFDADFYERAYPEVKNYYFNTNLSREKRLYHHYINYHKSSDPPYCLNLNELKKQLHIDVEPPESFDPIIYKKLYLPNDPYFDSYSNIIDFKHLMYHHYLNYGKDFGHSCDHDVMVFFHVPKCGGTSLHYGTLLPSFYRQYHCNKNYIYNIDWIDKNNRNLFATISYSDNDSLSDLFDMKQYKSDNQKQDQDYLRRMTTELNETNLGVLLNNSKLLCVIFNAAGFQEHKKYLQNLIPVNQRHNKYIILREPIDLQMSTFYYLRDIGQWERTYGKFPKDMSFSEYIRHPDNYVNNWLIRNMAQLTDQDIINGEHAEICKEELYGFTKIGFLEHFDNFIEYLHTKYNWMPHNPASTIHSNKNNISKKEKLNEDDLALLQHMLYYEQGIYDYFLNKHNQAI